MVSPISPPLMMLAVVWLFAWMLFRPKETAPLKIFALITALMLFGPVSNWVMDAAAAATPWKRDYSLYLIDKSIGVSAFSIARLLSDRQRDVLFVIYLVLGHFMIVWYALNLKLRNGRPKPLLLAYLISYGLAPLFYLVAPAYGPRHAFGAAFPMGDPQVSPVPVHLAGWPNAIPSLHFATAILLVYFSCRNRILQTIAWLFLLGTGLATLAFEHYLIDLVVGIPYAYFAIRTAEGRYASSSRNLVLALSWLLSIRFSTPLILAHPWLLRMAVLATVATGVLCLRDNATPSGKTREAGADQREESNDVIARPAMAVRRSAG